MGEYAELRDRVDGWLEHKAGIDRVDIVGSVDEEVVRFRPLSVDGICLAFAQRAACLFESSSQGNNSWLEQSELREVATV